MSILGVNIDHVATLRQARREENPDPILAAQICEKSGARSIVAHLREDRRHIQDRDIILLKKTVKTRLNLEMSVWPEIVEMACMLKPNQATLVPERRQEITTEGGLDVVKNYKKLERVCNRLNKAGIEISFFIAPEKKQIDATQSLGVHAIELHTGQYAKAFHERQYKDQLTRLLVAAEYGRKCSLKVHAGHGLDYENIIPLARRKIFNEFNIGHAIIAKSIFIGLPQAVKSMVRLIK